MVKMSDYQIGAFEALEWTWHILQKYDEKPHGIKDAPVKMKTLMQRR